MFPNTYVPGTYVPQNLCSPVSMFPGTYIPLILQSDKRLRDAESVISVICTLLSVRMPVHLFQGFKRIQLSPCGNLVISNDFHTDF